MQSDGSRIRKRKSYGGRPRAPIGMRAPPGTIFICCRGLVIRYAHAHPAERPAQADSDGASAGMLVRPRPELSALDRPPGLDQAQLSRPCREPRFLPAHFPPAQAQVSTKPPNSTTGRGIESRAISDLTLGGEYSVDKTLDSLLFRTSPRSRHSLALREPSPSHGPPQRVGRSPGHKEAEGRPTMVSQSLVQTPED